MAPWFYFCWNLVFSPFCFFCFSFCFVFFKKLFLPFNPPFCFIGTLCSLSRFFNGCLGSRSGGDLSLPKHASYFFIFFLHVPLGSRSGDDLSLPKHAFCFFLWLSHDGFSFFTFYFLFILKNYDLMHMTPYYVFRAQWSFSQDLYFVTMDLEIQGSGAKILKMRREATKLRRCKEMPTWLWSLKMPVDAI